MQATMTINRSGNIGRARLLVRLVLALAAAVALGFALGNVASPSAHVQQPAIKYVPVIVNSDERGPSHGALW
jgi:hypothetical protein